MKIVDRKTFMVLPENTLFSKWEPCVFGELTIKGKSWEHDFLTQEIASAVKCNDSGEFADLCDQAARTGESVALDLDCMGRDGCFDEDQMFAVWEAPDVLALIERLKTCMPNMTGKASLDPVVVRGITPLLRRAFNHALGLANQSGHKYVGAEHMLLGLLMEPDSAAHCLLRQQGLDTYQLLRNLQNAYDMEIARAHNIPLCVNTNPNTETK